MSDNRFDSLEKRLESVEEKLDSVLDMVSVGKGAIMAAKVLGWVTATLVGVIELWRSFHK